MKLLVFAHKPPPHHGQSCMIERMLDAFGGDRRRPTRIIPSAVQDDAIECYHVDARLSKGIDDIGRPRKAKIFLLLKYSLEAVWCRFRYGVRNFYYVPAPGQRVPLYRDWIVMAICRPFFGRMIFHTHAIGLGSWLEKEARPWERLISRRLLGNVDLNIALSEYYRDEVMKLSPRRVAIVPIGIPDPCPDFESVLPRRSARVAARRTLLAEDAMTEAAESNAGNTSNLFHVLFLSMCSREKGLFDTLDAVAQFHQKLRREKSRLHLRLDVVGKFLYQSERTEFDARITQLDLQENGNPIVKYHGFVDTETKHRLFRDSDCFCFPTYYQAEAQPANLVEALAFGLPIVTTRWRAIPDLFAQDYPGLVEIKSPAQIARALESLLYSYPAASFRETFLTRFTEDRYIENLKTTLLAVGR